MDTAHALSDVLSYLRRYCGGPTDGELLAQFVRARDEAAFAELVRRHGGLVLSVARRHLSDRQQAEDVFQATFLALARQAPRLGRPPSLVNWLYTVAVRQAKKARARTARHAAVAARLTPPALPASDPLAEISGRELVALIDEELMKLPEAYRLPLLLCGLEGLSRDEAARRLGWPAGSVKGRLERGRELLRQRLAKRGLTVPAVLAGALAAGQAAAVPTGLVRAAARAAVAAPASAAWGTVKLVALAAGLLTALGGAGLALRPVEHPAEPLSAPAAPGPRVERDGAPLPAGAVLRIGDSRFRMEQIQYTPDGRLLATIRGNALAFVDPETGREVRRWPEAPFQIFAFDFSRDGKTALLWGFGFVEVWDAVAGRCRHDLLPPAGHPFEASSWKWGQLIPDGRRAITVSGLTKRGVSAFLIWDTGTGQPVKSLLIPSEPGQTSITGMTFPAGFLPDGKTLVEFSTEGDARLIDTDAGRAVRAVHHDGGNWFVLANGGRSLIGVGKDRSLRQWDLASGREEAPFGGRVKSALCFHQSTDGRWLAWTEDFRAVRLLDITNGRERPAIPIPPDGGRFHLHVAPDGQSVWVVAPRNVWRRFDTATGRELTPPVRGHRGYVADLAFSPDGTTLFTCGSDQTARAWDLTTGAERRRLVSCPGEQNHCLVLSPGGATLARGDEKDGTIELWDTATGQRRHRIPSPVGARPCFDPTGRWLAMATPPTYEVQLWDARTGQPAGKLEGAYGYHGFAFSPDGQTLAVPDRPGPDGKVYLRDITPGPPARRVSMDLLRREPCFSPDGRTLAGFGDDRLYLLEIATGRPRFTMPSRPLPRPSGYPFHYFSFSPDGRLLAVAADRHIDVYDTHTGERRQEFTGHDQAIVRVRFAPDGLRLVTSSLDGTVLVWAVADRRTAAKPPTTSNEAELDAAWDKLTSAEADAAFRAMGVLTAAPDQALPLLRERLRPAPTLNTGRVRELIRQLDSPRFADRQQAERELDRLADRAAGELRAALRGATTAQARQALQRLLDRLESPTPETLRAVRAVEVLEHIGTPAAKEHLWRLADGAAGAPLTDAAAAAIRRLGE